MGLRLHLSSGDVLAFCSKYTGVGGWDEIGSLNIKFEINNNEIDPDVFVKVDIEKFHVNYYMMLVYEESEVYSESGICFINDKGEKLMILAAPSPGAVSVSIPGVKTEFKPEFSLSDYKMLKVN